MKTTGQDGFIMVFVIISLVVVAVVMYVLADGSNTMLFQTDAAYLRAAQRNLVASGLAWTRNTVEAQNTEAFGKAIELDVTGLGIREANLSVTINMSVPQKPQAQIDASCTRKRRTLAGKNEYPIDL